MTEHLSKNNEERLWGYRQPVVLIESQSAPILLGDEVEQRYMRGCNLAKKGDLVVTDFPLNESYVYGYLDGVLGLALPEYLVVKDLNLGCLSNNLLDFNNKVENDYISNWARKNEAKLQFFNISASEKNLVEYLGIEPMCGNIDNVLEIGSKTGFRRLAESLKVPMSKGYVCNDIESTLLGIENIARNGSDVVLKAKEGTGGNELKSNYTIENKVVGKADLLLGELNKCMGYFGKYLGDEWVVEEKVKGDDGSIHVFINNRTSAEKAYVLGSISEHDSYAGGYFPFIPNSEQMTMIDIVNNRLVPAMQEREIFGHHCFDFKGKYFLEDNIRPGALDFVDGLVRRVMEKHHPNKKFAYWHCHVNIPRATTFEEVYSLIGSALDPNGDGNDCFSIISNQEVLPYGRALDLTSVCFGSSDQIVTAKHNFDLVSDLVKAKLTKGI